MRAFHPTIPVSGNGVSATLVKQLIAEIRASRVIAGPGVNVRRTPSGTHVSAERGYQQAGSGFNPWKLSVTEENGERKVEWRNKVIQLGMSFVNYDDEKHEGKFKDETDGRNGDVYLKVSLAGNKPDGTPEASCVIREIGEGTEYDHRTDCVYFHLGYIDRGRMKSYFPGVPVIYRNLK